MSLVAGADLRLGRHFQCKACRDRLMDYPTLLIPRLRASACAFTTGAVYHRFSQGCGVEYL